MVDVGDAIRDAYDLTLPCRWMHLSSMVTYPVSDLDCKVETIPSPFEMVDYAQGMFVVSERTSVGREGTCECVFSCVSERGMAEVVPEGDRLGEVFVEAKRAGDGA